MIDKINHIGIIVKNLEKAVVLYEKGLGLELESVEELKEYNNKIAFFKCGEVLIELIEPTGPGIAMDYLCSHGEGIHHICYETHNIESAMANAKRHFELLHQTPQPGSHGSRIFFLQSSSIFGAETEFLEMPHLDSKNQ
jgi:methylmalonyl-CoA/ethylmalonyl-CoA epimerase